MINLHTHDEWSRLDGQGSAQLHAKHAAELGQFALAKTNHGTLSGALHHIEACKTCGILAINGVEAYFKPDRHDREERTPSHLCLFAKNLKGWHSLLEATTESNKTGFYAYPCIDWEVLEKYSEGVVCSTACINSYLSRLIMAGDDKGAREYIRRMQNIFGDDFYFEIMPHDFAEQRTLNINLWNLGQEYGIPVIATADAHYPRPEWFPTYKISGFMKTKMSFEKLTKKKNEGKKVLEFDLPSLYLMSGHEIEELFEKNHPDLPHKAIDEAILNTDDFANMFGPIFLDKSNKMPNVKEKVPDPEQTIIDWAREGMEARGKTGVKEYEDRLEYELGVLKDKDVFDYFYIVGEAVRWAKENGVRVGLGRGSAAGSLVSHLIGITAIDPIAYGLLFERFLNPHRKGMPDIDIDFDSKGRQRVKDHLGDMWGQDKVADIIAHQTFKPRAVIADVSRVFDIPYPEVNEVTKTIDIRPDDEETTLEQIKAINPTLNAFAEKHPELWEHCLKIEGSIRNASKHAAGLVITKEPISHYMPLERGKEGDLVTAWNDSIEFPAISIMGFMKYDFLGIAGLSKQDHALRLIDEDIDLNELPCLFDPYAVETEVMQAFERGLTLGVWQFSGENITALLKSMHPDWIGDITAANALWRPGPMEIAFDYGKNKKKPEEEIDYWHEKVKPILKETYGLVAYQEQVMEITKQIGGFSPAQADDMRKAIGKLYRLPGSEAREFMEGYRSIWDEGAKKNGLTDIVSEEIWEKILKFSGYGFNKSHSACYSVQAYQDMWLKVNYPAAFYAALMTGEKGKNAQEKQRKRQAAVREAAHFGVKILPPDINVSGDEFTVDEGNVRFGLLAVSYVGQSVCDQIKNNRPFESLEDFDEKMRKKGNVFANKRARENLIACGAFDTLGARQDKSDKEKSKLEKEILGVPMSMMNTLAKNKHLIEDRIYSKEEFDQLPSKHNLTKSDYDKSFVIVAGEVVSVKKITTKKGDPMAFLNIAYGLDEYRCVLFPDTYNMVKDKLNSTAVMVSGHKDAKVGEPSVIVDDLIDVEELAEEKYA